MRVTRVGEALCSPLRRHNRRKSGEEGGRGAGRVPASGCLRSAGRSPARTQRLPPAPPALTGVGRDSLTSCLDLTESRSISINIINTAETHALRGCRDRRARCRSCAARLLQQREELQHVQVELQELQVRRARLRLRLAWGAVGAARGGPGEGGLDVANAELRGRGVGGAGSSSGEARLCCVRDRGRRLTRWWARGGWDGEGGRR